MKVFQNCIDKIFIVSSFFIVMSCQKDSGIIPDSDLPMTDNSICENAEADIHADSWAIFPYQNNLKSINFSDSMGIIYKFYTVEFYHEFITINSTYNVSVEQFQYILYSADLNIYISTHFLGTAATFDCPNSITYFDYISLSAPFKNTPVSDPSQSSNYIRIEYDAGGIIIPESHIGNMKIINKEFSELYSGKGEIDILFNFEYGICGLISKMNNLYLEYHSVDY